MFYFIIFVLGDVNIKANYDTVDSHKIGDYREPLTLECNVEGQASDSKYLWKWLVYSSTLQ